MKKFFAVLTAVLLLAAVLSGCGSDQNDTVDKKDKIYAEQSTAFPQIDQTLITEDDYQFITLDETDFIYKVTGVSTQRTNIAVPQNGSLTVQLSLTNSSERAKEYTVALWQSDGNTMSYLTTVYFPAGEGDYSYTFTGLDSALAYRAVVSCDRGTATGYIALQNATLYSAVTLEDEAPAEEM